METRVETRRPSPSSVTEEAVAQALSSHHRLFTHHVREGPMDDDDGAVDGVGDGNSRVFLMFLVPVLLNRAHSPWVGRKTFPGPMTIFREA